MMIQPAVPTEVGCTGSIIAPREQLLVKNVVKIPVISMWVILPEPARRVNDNGTLKRHLSCCGMGDLFETHLYELLVEPLSRVLRVVWRVE